MTKAKKKVYISVLTALLGVVLGLFCVFFRPTMKRGVNASAASSTFYFETGAAAYVGTTSIYSLRYSLHVSKSDFTSDTDTLLITFTDYETARPRVDNMALMEKGCRFNLTKSDVRASDGTTLLIDSLGLATVHNDTSYGIFIDYADMVFDSNGKAIVKAVVDTELLTTDITVKAFIVTTATTNAFQYSQSATSDTRNVLYIWQKAIEYEDPAIANNEEYLNAVVDFANNTESTSFALSTAVMLDASYGMRLLLNIDTATYPMGEYYNSGWESVSLAVDCKTTKERFLKIVRTTSPSIPTSGSIYNPNNQDVDVTEFVYNLEDGQTLLNVDIPLPADPNTEYYYYAQIVHKKFLNFGRSLTHSDPLLYDDETTWTIEAITDHIQFSTKTLAENILTKNLTLTEEENAWLQDVAGLSPSTETISVTVHYKELDENSGIIVDVTKTFDVKSVNAFSSTLVQSQLFQNEDIGKSSITDFNVNVYRGYYEEGRYHETGEQIKLKSKDFSYSYNVEDEEGYITVNYSDFGYEKFSLNIKNNDPTNHLEMDVYTTDVSVGADETTITFAYDTLQTNLFNTAGWLFTLKSDDVKITNNTANVTATAMDSAVKVSFPNSAENELMNLSVNVVSDIVEDVDYSVTYEYVELSLDENGEIMETTKTSEPFTMKYSELINYNAANFFTDYGDVIDAALLSDKLPGYYTKNSASNDMSNQDLTCNIVVTYKHKALFKIVDGASGAITYKPLTAGTTSYKGAFIVNSNDIPSDHRVMELATSSNNLVISNEEDYTETLVTVYGEISDKILYPITINYTDGWDLKLTYYKTYVNYAGVSTPFATQETATATIKLADYENVYNITATDISEIFGIDLEVCGLVRAAEKVSVSFDDVSTYNVTLDYGKATINKIDYNGTIGEIQIPITNYAEWCEELDVDWSIMFLNRSGKKWFNYATDISRNELYGFFSVAVFDEKVSDFNRFFKNVEGTGCMSLCETETLVGSKAYKIFGEIKETGIFYFQGLAGMAFCELLNDSNKTVYTNFFYLDGSSDEAYISNGGADSSTDTDNAGENFGEDVKDGVSDLIEKGKENPLYVFIAFCLGALGIVGLVVVSYKLLAWAGIVGKKKTTRKKKK